MTTFQALVLIFTLVVFVLLVETVGRSIHERHTRELERDFLRKQEEERDE